MHQEKKTFFCFDLSEIKESYQMAQGLRNHNLERPQKTFVSVERKVILNSLRINLCTYGKTLRLPFINSVNTSNVFK